MALTTRERNMVIGIVAVLVIAAIAAAFWLGSRSGDDKATTATTPTATQTTPTVDMTVATVTSVETVTQTETQPGAGVAVVEQSIEPGNATAGAPIVLMARTRGNVTSVKMEINGPDPKSVNLVKGVTVDNITGWAAGTRRQVSLAPYAYKAVATAADGIDVDGPISAFIVLP